MVMRTDAANKETLLRNLEKGLKKIILEGLEGSDKKTMKTAIKRFIKEHASHYSAQELEEKFSSPHNAVKLFFAFLEDKGEPQSTSVH